VAQNSKVISSTSNAHFKFLKSLLVSTGIRNSQAFLLSGERLVHEFYREMPKRFTTVVLPEGLSNPYRDLPEVTLSRALFETVDVFNTKFAILVGTVPKFVEYPAKSPPIGSELLVGLGDPANLGAVLRSAEAFGFHRIVLLQESSHPFHPKALRASSGSSLRLNFIKGPSIQSIELSAPLYALDLTGDPLAQIQWPADFRLLVGLEGLGVPSYLKPQRVQIPMSGNLDSLNAAVAASIAMYDAFAKRGGLKPSKTRK
jgi:TrmH family RNA methyltransferase